MSLLTRHNSIVSYINEAFGIQDLSKAEELIKFQPTLSSIDEFFTVESRGASLYMYYLTPEEAALQKCCVMRVKYRRGSFLNNNLETREKGGGRRNSIAKKFNNDDSGSGAGAGTSVGHEPLGCIKAFFTEDKGVGIEGSENRPIVVLTKPDAQAYVDSEKNGDSQLFMGVVKQPLQNLDAVVRNLI